MENIEFGMKPREKGFYEENIGNAVNLFGVGETLSGDLVSFNRREGTIKLTNYIERVYNPDGNSQYIENPEEIEIEIRLIQFSLKTTREDRLGRIAKYTQNLLIEELEKEKKLRGLVKKANSQNRRIIY